MGTTHVNNLPEDGLHIASGFVHSILLIVSIFHLGFASSSRFSPDETSASGITPKYDHQKHIIISFRTAFAFVLAIIPLVELIYQLNNKLYPTAFPILSYTEQVLTLLAWSANFINVLFVWGKRCQWLYFHPLDHLCVVLSWIFVFIIQVLRVYEYVTSNPAFPCPSGFDPSSGVCSSTEQYTATLTLSFGLFYGITLGAFFLVDLLRKNGKCADVYEEIGSDLVTARDLPDAI